MAAADEGGGDEKTRVLLGDFCRFSDGRGISKHET